MLGLRQQGVTQLPGKGLPAAGPGPLAGGATTKEADLFQGRLCFGGAKPKQGSAKRSSHVPVVSSPTGVDDCGQVAVEPHLKGRGHGTHGCQAKAQEQTGERERQQAKAKVKAKAEAAARVEGSLSQGGLRCHRLQKRKLQEPKPEQAATSDEAEAAGLARGKKAVARAKPEQPTTSDEEQEAGPTKGKKAEARTKARAASTSEEEAEAAGPAGGKKAGTVPGHGADFGSDLPLLTVQLLSTGVTLLRMVLTRTPWCL